MKLSVSLPNEDLEFLDQYAKQQGFDSRSAVLHRAVRLLKASSLEAAYEAAWAEWRDSEEDQVWEQAIGDGLTS